MRPALSDGLPCSFAKDNGLLRDVYPRLCRPERKSLPAGYTSKLGRIDVQGAGYGAVPAFSSIQEKAAEDDMEAVDEQEPERAMEVE